MFDPLGLRKDEPGSPPEPAPAAKPARDLSRSPTLWMGLLGVDIIIVAVFGGILAQKIHRHATEPKAAAKAPAKPKAEKPAPKAEAPKPAEAAPDAKAEPEVKPEPKPEPKAELKPEPKADPKPEPKPQAKAEPAKAKAPPPKPSLSAAAPKEPASAAPKVKAVPVDFKLREPSAKSVQLIGAFLVRGGGRKDMVRSGDDWTLTLYLHPGEYRYAFVVNGKKTLDPANPRIERGQSVIIVTPLP